MAPSETNIVVEILDQRFNLDDVVAEAFPPEIDQWELGGFTDPLGQLVGWLWSQIQSAFNLLTATVRSLIGSISTTISAGINSISSTVSTALSNVYSRIGTISTTVQSISSGVTSVLSTITGALTTITSAIAGLGTWFTSLRNAITALGSSILSGVSSTVTSVFNTLRSWLTTAIAGIQTTVLSMGSMITSLSTTIGNLAYKVTSALSGAVSTIGNVIQTAIGSLSSTVQQISGYLSTLGRALSGVLSQITTTLTSFGSQIWQGILGLKDWILSGLQTIGTALTQMGSQIATFFAQIPRYFTDLWAWLEGGWNKLVQDVGAWWNQSVKWWSEQIQNIQRLSGEVHTTLMGFFNPLIDMGATLKSLATAVTNFVKDPWGTIKETLGKAFEPILKPLQGLWDTLVKMGEAIVNFFRDPWTAIKNALEWAFGPLIKPLEGLWDNLVKMGDALVNFFKDPWGTIQKVLGDLFKPLEGIGKWIESVGKSLGEFFKDPIGSIKAAFAKFYEWIEPAISWVVEKIHPLLTKAWDALSLAGKWVMEKVGDFVSWAWEGLQAIGATLGKLVMSSIKGIIGLGSNIANLAKGVITAVIQPVINLVGTTMSTFFDELSLKILGGKAKGEWIEMGLFTMALFTSQFAVRWIGQYLLWLADLWGPIPISLDAFLRPLGLGVKGGTGIQIYPAGTLRHIAAELKKYPDELGSSMIYGMAIWLSQPFARMMSSVARDRLPVHLPTLAELVESTRRAMPTGQFAAMKEFIYKNMSLYGYATTVVDWYTQPPEGDWKVEVKDRFNKDRILPRSVLYEMPTPTDMCRMMLRDVFGPPEKPFPNFQKAILMRGMNADVAKMYYMLHFRYPEMDKLYEFMCRAAVGFAWVSAEPEPEDDLGAAGAVAPVALNADVTTGTGLSTFLGNAIKKWLKYYSKWHDYAPFAWAEGFTADRLIVMDMMADIPMRIDARWMYKWAIIEDLDLFRITVAKGMHPRWVEDVTVGEAMNALAEERTYARSGIVNVFERGFLTAKVTDTMLSELTTVTILGKPRPVKFLEGERKLLILRHVWDRALNVLRGVWTNLTMGFQRNITTSSEVVSEIVKVANGLESMLGIDLEVDEKYLSLWVDSLGTRRDIETIQRIRYWMRIFIYRATQLAESGEAFEKIVRQYAEKAMLTTAETEIMLELGNAFITAYKRNQSLSRVQNYVKGRIKTGQMTKEEGIAQLVKAGMTKGDAQIFIESSIQTRVVSVDKLISMREVIPINATLLKRKMDAEGVPPDEQALYIPYAVATELQEEMSKAATESVNDFIAGTIDEAQLKTELDNLATLNGTTKTKIGVDWIVLSPEEREFLVAIAKKRLARKAPAEGEAVVKPHIFTPDKIISIAELIPVKAEKLRDAMAAQNVPADEQEMYVAFSVASELKEEMGKIVTELIADYAKRVFTDIQFKAQLDALATLNGVVPQVLKIPWIVYSPQERQMLFAVGQLRRARTKA